MLDRIALITGNVGKAAEYAAMPGIEVTPDQGRADRGPVPRCRPGRVSKAADAFARLGEHVLVDDTGLAIHAWNGLPVPSSRGSSTPSARKASWTWPQDWRPPRDRHHGARLCRRHRSPGIPGNRRRLPGHRAARHLQLRLRPCLHPRHRQRTPHLRADDQRGKEQDLLPKARSRGNAKRRGA
jgi:Ham1 family